MSKENNTTSPILVNFVVPVFKDELEDFREYCKTIDADPRTVVYGFIRAVNQGRISVAPPSNAPLAQ